MNIGKAFRTVRENQHISRPSMAKQLGLTPSALWKIEAGASHPKWDTVHKFIAVMHIPVAYFYSLAMDLEDYICP